MKAVRPQERSGSFKRRQVRMLSHSAAVIHTEDVPSTSLLRQPLQSDTVEPEGWPAPDSYGKTRLHVSYRNRWKVLVLLHSLVYERLRMFQFGKNALERHGNREDPVLSLPSSITAKMQNLHRG